MKIRDCDDAKLAVLLKKLPLTSFQLGHAKAHGTVRDYMVPDGSNVELEFVYDLFTMRTTELIDKWYGGEENALDLHAQIDALREQNEEEK